MHTYRNTVSVIAYRIILYIHACTCIVHVSVIVILLKTLKSDPTHRASKGSVFPLPLHLQTLVAPTAQQAYLTDFFKVTYTNTLGFNPCMNYSVPYIWCQISTANVLALNGMQAGPLV